MAAPSRSRTVLIVDEDLGFVLWVGQLLAEAGYPAVPAFDCQQAISHIREFKATIDLAIVNPSLSGAAEMLQTLGRANRNLGIILIRDPGAEVPPLPADAIAILEKPRSGEPIYRQDWFEKLRKVLAEAPPFAENAPSKD